VFQPAPGHQPGRNIQQNTTALVNVHGPFDPKDVEHAFDPKDVEHAFDPKDVEHAKEVSDQGLGRPVDDPCSFRRGDLVMLRQTRLLAVSLGCLLSVSAALSQPPGEALPEGVLMRLGSPRPQHGGPITALAWAADGKSLATASGDGTLSLWDIPSGRELVRFLGHQREVRGVAFLPGSSTLVSVGIDGTVRLWDAKQPAEGQAIQRRHDTLSVRVSGEPICALAVSPTGKTVAIAQEDSRIRLLNATNLEELARVDPEGPVRCLAFSPDGETLASSRDNNGLTLREAATLKEKKSFGPESVVSLAFSPDGKEIAVGTYDNKVQVWSVADGVLLNMGIHQRGSGRYQGVYAVVFGPSLLASGGADGVVRLKDLASGEPKLAQTDPLNRVLALAFSPDGKRLASGGIDGTLRIWDPAIGKLLLPAAGGSRWATALHVSEDGRLALLHHTGDRLALWDLTTGKEQPLPVPVARLQGQISAADFAGPKKLVCVTQDGRCETVSLDEKAVSVGFALETRLPRALAVTPDASTVAIGGADRQIGLWDLTIGTPVRQLQLEGDTCVRLAVSSDGQFLASAGSAARIRVWDLTTGKARPDLPGHAGGVLALAFTPDGRTLASCGKDRTVRLWEMQTGKERMSFPGDAGWISALAVSPDGRALAAGTFSGQVHLWDLRRGRQLQDLSGHRGQITGLAFLPDRAALLSTAGDGATLLWDVSSALKDGKVQIVKLDAPELKQLWDHLGSQDATAAAVAVQTLARAPDQVLPLVRDRIVPVSAEKISKLIKDLSDTDPKVREQSMAELTRLGKAAEPTLRKEVKQAPSLEALICIEELLQRTEGKSAAPEYLQALRAVEVLELLATKDARAHLETLAGGLADAELTRQASASLQRLNRRP
jgi:WD40 repeat protein